MPSDSGPPAAPRPNHAPLKVIGLGLGRTGTASLRDALELLGFGPCYHMFSIIITQGKDFPTWCKIGDGNGSPDDFDDIFRNFHSAVDYPSAIYPAELYAAYPDAKFILTTRNPAKWHQSMKATILKSLELLDTKSAKSPYEEKLLHWHKVYQQDGYHQGRLYTDQGPQELLDHNERVKHIIPADKLLVYEIGEGWDRLVDFLGVPKPAEPFPHVNDTAEFQAGLAREMEA